jgi:hypothetical protein
LSGTAPAGLRVACALAALLALPACGKRGDPLAPLPRTPQAVTALALAQRGAEVELTYTAPRVTTGGAGLTVLDVEVLRADTEGDFAKVSQVKTRRVAPGEALRETVPLPAVGTTLRVAARARAGSHVSGLTPIATLKVLAPQPAPTDLKAQLTPRGVSLSWTAPPGGIPKPLPTPTPSPSPSPRPGVPVRPSPPPSAAPVPSPVPGSVSAAPSPAPAPSPTPIPSPTPAPSPTPPPPPSTGYWVYRREPGGRYETPLQAVPLQAAAHEDTTVAPGQSVCYVVRLVAATAPVIESASSNEACLDVKDVAAPAAPAGVATLVREGAVELSWSPSSEPDLQAYRVYRARTGATPERLAEVAAGESTYRDTAAERGVPFFYTVTAVDAAGNESPPSAAAEGSLP